MNASPPHLRVRGTRSHDSIFDNEDAEQARQREGEERKALGADSTAEGEMNISPTATSVRDPRSRFTSLIRGLFLRCGYELTPSATSQECLFFCFLAFALTVFLAERMTRLTMVDRMSAAAALVSEERCAVDLGRYEGPVYSSAGQDAETVSNKCLVRSPWMRVAEHSVNMAGGYIDSWLWIDYHDRINVLVESPDSSEEDPVFMILSQTKYALPSSSLAVVGGIIEPDEMDDSLGAAKREVLEELGVVCQGWTNLGKYRTDVNRGMGWVHPFMARDCAYSTDSDVGDAADGDAGGAVGARDTERQEVRHMKLADVHAAALRGEFVEVQWSNTVSLALLSLAELRRSPGQYLSGERNTMR